MANLSSFYTTSPLVTANVVSTLTANNATFAYGKAENALSVNNAVYLGGSAANTYAPLASPTFTGNVAISALQANGSVGSNNQILTSNGSTIYWASPAAGGSTTTAIASGTLSNGVTVVINANGTVSAVAATTSNSSFSTPTAASIGFGKAAFDTANNKIIITWEQGGNNEGWIVVGTISGTTITFGTAVQFRATGCRYPIVEWVPSISRFVYVYRDQDNGSILVMGYGSISGTTPTILGEGTADFSGAVVPTNIILHPPSGKILVIYFTNYPSANRNRYAVITPSAGGLSVAGAGSVWAVPTDYYPTLAYDPTSQRLIIAYGDTASSSRGTVNTINISGTTVSFGRAAIFNINGSTSGISIAYCDDHGKFVISYLDGADSSFSKAIVGSATSSGIITLGTPSIFSRVANSGAGCVYDTNINKIVVYFSDATNSNYPYVISGTITDYSIAWSTAELVSSSGASGFVPLYSTTSARTFAFYTFTANSTLAYVFATPSYFTTNLTTSNFIGFSGGSYSNGQTATIQVVGSVSNSQSGLTPGQKYYVQYDGTLSTSVGDFAAYAGVATSANNIIVKG